MISMTSERFSFPVSLPVTSLFPPSQINSTVSLPGGGSGPPEDVKPPVLGVRGLHCPPPPGGPGAGKRLCAICGDRSSGMGLRDHWKGRKRVSDMYHHLWDSQGLMGLHWSKWMGGSLVMTKGPEAQMRDGGWSGGRGGWYRVFEQ